MKIKVSFTNIIEKGIKKYNKQNKKNNKKKAK